MSTKYSYSAFEAQIDKDTVEKTREITFVIASEATGREHRNKFLYNWANWNLDKFNSNPIVGYQHNVYGDNMCLAPNPDDVIGKATAWIDTFRNSRVLMSKATFEPPELNQTAEKVFRKIIWGSLNASSTGVIPIGNIETEVTRNEKNQVTDVFFNFPGQELVEWSIVHIPADANALRRSLKSHTMAAITFIQKSLPELSYNDITKMTVEQILSAYENRFSPELLDITIETKGSDPELNKMQDYLKSIKK